MVRSILDDEWQIRLDFVLEWVVPRAGFDVREGIVNPNVVEVYEIGPFIRWPTNCNRNERCAEALIGWESLKTNLK